VEIINLGLDPAEAIDMGLPVEKTQSKSRRSVPVADYIAPEWREWLQTQRVELNAMDSPTFLEWLDGKVPPAKLIPPPHVLAEWLTDETRAAIRSRLVSEALLTARVDERTDEALNRLNGEMYRVQTGLALTVEKTLAADPALPWTSPVVTAATKLARKHKHSK